MIEWKEKRETLNRALSYPDRLWAYHQILTNEDRTAMDLILVVDKDPIAFEPGTNEGRFQKLHQKGHRF